MRSLPVIVIVIALGGCFSTSAPHAPDPRPPHPVFARVRAGVDLDGAPAARHFAPGDPTIFVVFASWCGPCRKELQILTTLHESEPRVHVIGLNAYEDFDQLSDETRLRAYVAANAPWLPVVRGDAAILAGLGGVPKIPSVFVFDGEGHLVQRFKRNERVPPTLAELEATLAPLLP